MAALFLINPSFICKLIREYQHYLTKPQNHLLLVCEWKRIKHTLKVPFPSCNGKKDGSFVIVLAVITQKQSSLQRRK